MDRRNDPMTPLLSQWTYQAMIHELLEIRNGRVDLSHLKDSSLETKEIVLSSEQDSFFKANMYLNLGDLGQNIKQYVDNYQEKHNSTKEINSITDMKRFVEEYPEFKKLAGNVSKHVTLVGELSKLVNEFKLLDYGELEQSLAVTNSANNHAKMVESCLSDPNVPNEFKVRIVLLYAIRYEKTIPNKISQFVEILRLLNVPQNELHMIRSILTFAGSEVRLDPTTPVEDFIEITKGVIKGLKV
jgi:hypothetical protein